MPTAVVVGPDGAYYVSELTGAPFTEGAARVYRVVRGEAPTVFLAGFKTLIDLDFGPDGAFTCSSTPRAPSSQDRAK